jgi:hypothetical protein
MHAIFHDLFLRAYAIPTAKEHKRKKKHFGKETPKWPQFVLVFDTETRITADQSLTFGVYRLCQLANGRYQVVKEGIFYADDLPARERRVLEIYVQTAVSDVHSFPPEFPLLSRSEFMRQVFWPAIKRDGAMVCGFNLPFDLTPSGACLEQRRRKRMVAHDVALSRWSRKQKSTTHLD